MIIQVVGSGCSNCKKLLELTQEAVKVLNVKADVVYVTDLVDIAKTGLLRTPGLIINGRIVSYGRVPQLDEIKSWIRQA
jgi:small redox-active disulfide protein 2